MALSLNLVDRPTHVDPVCGMTVDPATAPASTEHEGRKIYFCCLSCLKKFQADPARYSGAAPSKSAMPPPGAGTKYTCPMHPEVVQDHPGACPKCGMALEPMAPSLEEGPNPELTDMSRRFWIGAA